MSKLRVIAFDLDGTLTQHRSPLEPGAVELLDALSRRYRLIMVGAGKATRIFNQMGHYPIDIIGNYGMQYCRYDPDKGGLQVVFDEKAPCDRESVAERIQQLRRQTGYLDYAGEGVEFHESGCVTFPLLGTAADIRLKLAFDPDRKKRSAFYEDVKAAFPEYTVFIGGSSSFDFAPHPYNKYYALDRFCREENIGRDEIVYVGDDYGKGGNDEALWNTDFRFIPTDDYRRTPELLKPLLY